MMKRSSNKCICQVAPKGWTVYIRYFQFKGDKMKSVFRILSTLLMFCGLALSATAQEIAKEYYGLTLEVELDGEIIGEPMISVKKGQQARVIVPGENGYVLVINSPANTKEAVLNRFGIVPDNQLANRELFELDVYLPAPDAPMGRKWKKVASPKLLAGIDGSRVRVASSIEGRNYSAAGASEKAKTLSVSLKAAKTQFLLLKKTKLGGDCEPLGSEFIQTLALNSWETSDVYLKFTQFGSGDAGIDPDENCCTTGCLTCCGGCCSDSYNCGNDMCCARAG